MAFITIFTPTYNRYSLIDNLYQSLLKQTQKNFEWLVVDDGSIDGTEKYFSGILSKKQPFPIRYIRQENGGKHRAINRGVKVAKGDLFFIVDSDDTLLSNAIEEINHWIDTLGGSRKWCGVAGLRGHSETKAIGQRPLVDFVDAKNTERGRYHLEGDKAEIYFTEVMKKHPFPEIPGENFISEEIVWNAIARDGYYLRWFDKIIYIGSYLDGGLTKDSTKDERNPQGCLLWAKGQLASFPHAINKRFLAIGIYRHAVASKESVIRTAEELSVLPTTVILASLSLYIYKKIFGNG